MVENRLCAPDENKVGHYGSPKGFYPGIMEMKMTGFSGGYSDDEGVTHKGNMSGWHTAFSIFQDPGFAEIYADHYRLAVLDFDGLVVMVRRIPLIGCLGGLLGGPEEHGPFESWWQEVRSLGCSYLCIHTNVHAAPLDAHLVSPADDCNFVIDLRNGEEQVLKNFHRTLHQNIRRALEMSISDRMVEDDETLRALYKVFQRISRGGTLFEIPPFALLRDLLHSPYGEALVVEYDGQIVGGLFLLRVSNVVYAWHGGPDPEMRHLNVGALLHYRAMQWGISKGFSFYDLGQQSLSENPGLTRFKMHFGPLLKPSFQYMVPQSKIKGLAVKALASLFAKTPRGRAMIPGCRSPRAG
ncbi:MAG: hypothetical protein C0392_04560 [Syntrophus sp. (in: bacteria)]|nr:hypothetical protein [Syntrophus sp. (in: bacteria)]